jgi:hypothetical protein
MVSSDPILSAAVLSLPLSVSFLLDPSVLSLLFPRANRNAILLLLIQICGTCIRCHVMFWFWIGVVLIISACSTASFTSSWFFVLLDIFGVLLMSRNLISSILNGLFRHFRGKVGDDRVRFVKFDGATLPGLSSSNCDS